MFNNCFADDPAVEHAAAVQHVYSDDVGERPAQ